MRECASITRSARASEFGQVEVAARVSRGGMYSINLPLAPHLIFIDHGNGLPHHTTRKKRRSVGLNKNVSPDILRCSRSVRIW
jgi:hypothetical protein